jgi:hypothetical protein
MVTDNRRTVRLYKHWDGYPTGVLPYVIAAARITAGRNPDALWFSKVMANEYRDEEKRKFDKTGRPYNKADLPRIDREDSFNTGFSPEQLGDQLDLEWAYVVNVAEKFVSVYQVDRELPQEAYAKGLSDPMVYAEELKEECKEGCRKETAKLIRETARTGWKVNERKERKILWNSMEVA